MTSFTQLVLGVATIQDVLDAYRKKNRYLQSPETKAICDAKHQAMEVLDLFFNMRFNVRLEVSPVSQQSLYNRFLLFVVLVSSV